MKTLCIYPHPPEGVNGVMRFVQSLYQPSFEMEVSQIGLWFDEYYKSKEKTKEAQTPQEKERLKRDVADKISDEFDKNDVIHLNLYAIDKDYVKLLENLKKAKPGKK